MRGQASTAIAERRLRRFARWRHSTHVIRVNPENPGSTADFGCELCYCGPGDCDFTLKLLTPRISNLVNLERTQRDAGAAGGCGPDTCASARTR